MSIWTDMHKRSNGTSVRKEDRVIPEENFQEWIPEEKFQEWYIGGKVLRQWIVKSRIPRDQKSKKRNKV